MDSEFKMSVTNVPDARIIDLVFNSCNDLMVIAALKHQKLKTVCLVFVSTASFPCTIF
jgi:hypothetical protein